MKYIFFGEKEKDLFLNLFIEAIGGYMDSNNIIHFKKKGKNATDKMRAIDVENLVKVFSIRKKKKW